ncbi:MAG TPA: hypothetical protein DCQ50_09050 [Chryseobacterium sp.]|nr:hypothetical protein [Chryseobacterium sp.]
MEQEDNKIIDSIREALYSYEIPYEEGSWEVFQKQYEKELNKLDKKQTPKLVHFWKFAATAAAIIVLVIAIYTLQNKREEKIFVKQGTEIVADSISQNQPIVSVPGKDEKIRTDLRHTSVTSAKNHSFTAVQRHIPNISEERNVGAVAQNKINDTKPLIDTGPQNNPDSYVDNSKIRPGYPEHPVETRINTNRWKFGVEINPSYVSDRINLGFGISTQFEFSKRIKLATGLSYSSITAIHKIDPVQMSADTTLTGAQSVIKALDIPFSIIYERKNGWYAAVGVSALAVLKENKVYEFESKVLQETFSTDPVNGDPVSVFKVVETNYNEKSAGTDFKGRNNLGYINLAIGKQYKIYGNTKILLEPFVKIPMGSLNNENVDLLNSGIKIRLVF